MRLPLHCRRLARERFQEEPEGPLFAATDRIREWCQANPQGTFAECREAMEADGSIVVSLTVLLILVELVYYGVKLWKERHGHGEAGDEE